MPFKEIHCLTCEFRVKLHAKTDIALIDECNISFRVQFNTEFPRQVMNFPIIDQKIASYGT